MSAKRPEPRWLIELADVMGGIGTKVFCRPAGGEWIDISDSVQSIKIETGMGDATTALIGVIYVQTHEKEELA